MENNLSPEVSLDLYFGCIQFKSGLGNHYSDFFVDILNELLGSTYLPIRPNKKRVAPSAEPQCVICQHLFI
jgi:hypothetical protein